jgi:PAS domain S-box-containing protein
MPITPSILKEYRCECGKLLFKGCLLISLVEVKCRACGRLTVFQGIQEESVVTPDRYVLMLDKHAHIMNASFNAQQLMGYNQAELLGQPLSIIVPHITADVLDIIFARLWLIPDRRNYYFEFEAMHRKKDGSRVPGMFRFKFVETQHGEYCFGMFHAAGPHAEMPEPEFANLPKFRPFAVHLDAMGTMLQTEASQTTPLGPVAELTHRSLAGFIADEAGRMKLAAKLAAKQAFSLQGVRLHMHDKSVQKTDLFLLPRVDETGAFQYYRTFFYGPQGPLQETA